MSAARWVPPLPPGWEAKFDPGQRTYFFINHMTKTTQWEDPRFSQPAAPVPTASAAATSLNIYGRSSRSSSEHETLQLKAFDRPALVKGKPSRQVQLSQAESTLSNEAHSKHLVQRILADFPTATQELVADMLRSCNNSEARTRQQLKDLGFGRKTSTTTGTGRSATSSSQGSQRVTSPQRGKSPARAATPKRELSETEKSAAVDTLVREFPQLDKDAVRIATATCNYNVNQGRELLKAWATKQRKKSGTPTRQLDPSPSRQPAAPSQQSLLPAGLSDDTLNTPGPAFRSNLQSGDGGQHRGGASSRQGSSSRSGPSPNRSAARPSGDCRAAAQSQQARAQHVTKMSKQLLSATSDLLSQLTQGAAGCCSRAGVETEVSERKEDKVGVTEGSTAVVEQSGGEAHRPRQKRTNQTSAVTSQPVRGSTASHAVSGSRTAAVGPNPELRKGPDGSLLMSEYSQALGPNSSIRDGPDPSRVCGPQGCMGPDVTLRCGSQPTNLSTRPGAILVSNF